MELVAMEELQHRYPDGTEVSFKGNRFEVLPGERVVVLGANGSGKTTLLAHIMGLLRAKGGKVRVFGLDPVKDFKQVRLGLGIVLQRVEEQLLGPTVFDDVAFSLRTRGCPPEEVKTMVDSVLQELAISHLAGKVPHYLSGGEKKKVALAGAMVLSPRLLLLDEPLDGLDPGSRIELLALLDKLRCNHGTALLVTTHDVELVPHLADRVYVLGRGGIVASGTPREILAQGELLREVGLEAPILVRLFDRLAASFGITPPLTLEEAERRLKPLLPE